jgi:CelD/BcsL family acetyltransferase involved in cellulose biosynthesis
VTAPAIERLDLADPAWTAFVNRCSEATVFHHPAWAAAVAETYGLTAFLLALPGDGGLDHALPCVELRGLTGRRRWVALPFTDHCPPLSETGSPPAELVERIAAARRALGIGDVEIRAELPSSADVHVTRETVRHVLDLRAGLDAVLDRFHPSQVRRNIRRAEREGVEVERTRAREALVDVFYRLHCLTRRRQGVPVQPRRFFERIWEQLVEPGLGYVAVARHEGEPLAAALFLSWNETTVYKFGASDDRRWDVRANHALFSDAIRTAVEEGRARFDFGRTELEQSSLRAFKSGWGADELPLRYCSVGPPVARRSSRGAAWARPVIQHSPVWVARALGAVSYRYAA